MGQNTVATLIDIGARLTDKVFENNVKQVIARASAVGVGTIIVNGINDVLSLAAVDLAVRNPKLYATVGIGPTHAAQCYGRWAKTLERLIHIKKVVAIGECGLDYTDTYFSPLDVQEKCLEAQLEYAADCGFPVVLFQQEAHEIFLEIMTRYRPRLKAVVLHRFSGDQEELAAYLDLDMHIGLNGLICNRKGRHLRKIIHLIPDDRLMIETTAPDELPKSMKLRPASKVSEPLCLPHICTFIAKCRGVTPQFLALATTLNAKNFFKI